MRLNKKEKELANNLWRNTYEHAKAHHQLFCVSQVVPGTLVIVMEYDDITEENFYWPAIVVGHNKKTARMTWPVYDGESVSTGFVMSEHELVAPIANLAIHHVAEPATNSDGE